MDCYKLTSNKHRKEKNASPMGSYSVNLISKCMSYKTH